MIRDGSGGLPGHLNHSLSCQFEINRFFHFSPAWQTPLSPENILQMKGEGNPDVFWRLGEKSAQLLNATEKLTFPVFQR
jgi:hypothetical protein